MLRFDIITVFPRSFDGILTESIIKRAQEKKKVKICVRDLRHYTTDKHRKVDDKPFGGGPGMVMQPQPIFDAVKAVKGRSKAKVILLTPSGKVFDQKKARQWAKEKHLILVCGHYEGIDERVRDHLADESISVGDYVLTGGEIPAMIIVDAVTRLVPGVLGRESSLLDESFSTNLLEYPQYTRPANFIGMKVPNVLLSGNHQGIKEWRLKQSILRTKKIRPDLLRK
ncbi:MAG TPA: tRNA (guanosine(37)-N1)-methyltransferase TrmD [Candidatus Omnitrophota bacterium]|mgnify:CR=1 FL=1|nr:tRNA (guanosine(37)-N1)-methyltransferase TrmD [Candidatus Omnitrophota bacterium]HQL41335.1 tRNA (guanosine(37)-N1)-methyltransferase TrmD [Candidatus Omnitrophota bacterium]